MLSRIFVFVFSISLLSAQDFKTGIDYFQAGKYEDAVKFFRQNRSTVESLVWLSKSLQENAQYQEALEAIVQMRGWERFVPLVNRVGELRFFLAEYDEARALFEQAVSMNERFIPARYHLGNMQILWGETEKANTHFNAILDAYRNTPYPDEELLYYTALACIHLNRFEDANNLFYDANKLAPKNWQITISWAHLFLEKFNYSDAKSTFASVFETNPNSVQAKIGMLKVSIEDDGQAVEQIIADLIDNHIKNKQVLPILGYCYILTNQREKAEETLDNALQKYPKDLELITMRGLLALGKKNFSKYENFAKQVQKLNPSYSGFYTEAGEFLSRTYLFKEAQAEYTKALKLNPDDVRARAGLGTVLSRRAKLDTAKEELERAFAKDPYNLWVGNLLQLFDSYVDYKILKTEHFEIRLHKDDAEIIGPYAMELAEEAYQKVVPKYNIEIDIPVTIEIFPKHDDFAVRCFGLPGSQAFLGICFGPLVTMNSPRARPVGTFNWQETLWHEFAHVVHLQLTNNRVPRWLAEGIAVWEATMARPEWAMNMEMKIFQALETDNLIPLKELNKGFVGDPRRVTYSYYQSSRMVEFIHDEYGMATLLALLDDFKNNKTTSEAIENTLSFSEEEFDNAFLTWLEKKRAPIKAEFVFKSSDDEEPEPSEEKLIDEYSKRVEENPNDFFAQMSVGRYHLQNENPEKGIAHLQKAIELYPDFISDGNAYEALAAFYLSENQKAKAAENLIEIVKRDGKNYTANKTLLNIAEELNNNVWQELAYANLIQIYPYDATMHKEYGTLLQDKNQIRNAIREFNIELALNPSDKADTHYRLGHNYLAMGDKLLAKRHALKALEIAPTFLDAQQLLLEISAN